MASVLILIPGMRSPIPVVVDLGGRATQLDVHAAAHEVGDRPLVRIPGFDAAVGVVCRVVQRDVACVGMEDHDNLRCRSPVRDVVRDEPKVEERRWHVSLERQGSDAEHAFTSSSFTGISLCSGVFGYVVSEYVMLWSFRLRAGRSNADCVSRARFRSSVTRLRLSRAGCRFRREDDVTG